MCGHLKSTHSRQQVLLYGDFPVQVLTTIYLCYTRCYKAELPLIDLLMDVAAVFYHYCLASQQVNTEQFLHELM